MKRHENVRVTGTVEQKKKEFKNKRKKIVQKTEGKNYSTFKVTNTSMKIIKSPEI